MQILINEVNNKSGFFDTISVNVSKSGKTAVQISDSAIENGVNIRIIDNNTVGIAVGEGVTLQDVKSFD